MVSGRRLGELCCKACCKPETLSFTLDFFRKSELLRIYWQQKYVLVLPINFLKKRNECSPGCWLICWKQLNQKSKHSCNKLFDFYCTNPSVRTQWVKASNSRSRKEEDLYSVCPALQRNTQNQKMGNAGTNVWSLRSYPDINSKCLQ